MTGTLGLFSLVDLFQLLAASSRSGRLTVDHPEGAARVYFEEGAAVHAEFAGFTGEQAVYALFSNEQGSFEFMLGVPAPQTTIEARTENLILEASRRLDESRRGGTPEKGLLAEPPGMAEAGNRELPPRSRAEAAQQSKPPVVRPADATGQRPDRARSAEPAQRPDAARAAPGVPAPKRPAAGSEVPAKRSASSEKEPELSHEGQAPTKNPEPRVVAHEPAKPASHEPLPHPATMTTTGSGSGITLTAIPSFAEKAKTIADMTLSKEEVELLRAVDGKRNVGQIAQQSGVSEEAVRAGVQRFVDFGVLRLSNRKPRTARLVTHLTKARLPHGIVGVDPSIMSAWEKSLGHPAQSIACRREDGRVCLLGAMPLDNAGPFLMINRETLMHADLAVNQPLLVKPVPQNES